MHAAYVRVWHLGGLGALALSALLALATLAGAPVAPRAHATLLVAGISFLSLAVALGLLPAFARRDWPAPLFAIAALGVGALALLVPFHERAFTALLGASLLLGAAQPLSLLLSPRWTTKAEEPTHRATDRAALAGVLLSLVGTAAGALLLIALPRGLPNAGLATLLVAGALPAAFGALLFVLPRAAREPLPAATLAYGALTVAAIAALTLALAFAFPVGASFRGPVAGVALAIALGTATLLRARREGNALLPSALGLGILAALALLLATLYGTPNALLPVALYAMAAFALVLVASALVSAAPILLPGKLRGARWMRWGPALLTAALFLHTPAIQYDRSLAPAAIVGAIGLGLLVRGLAALASNPRPAMRRR